MPRKALRRPLPSKGKAREKAVKDRREAMVTRRKRS